jgi:hypothetical protein
MVLQPLIYKAGEQACIINATILHEQKLSVPEWKQFPCFHTVKYRVAQKPVNLKHSLINGMVRFKPASQFVELYHSIVSCAFSMKDLILNSFCKFGK